MAIIVVDTAVGSQEGSFTTELKSALQNVGVNQTDIGYRQPFCFINMVGSDVSWKQEVLKRNGTEPSECHAIIY